MFLIRPCSAIENPLIDCVRLIASEGKSERKPSMQSFVAIGIEAITRIIWAGEQKMTVLQGKPRLSLWRIIQMNLGFLGLQFSFGLQQSNMSPIYKYLGAEESALPLLWLAGPMTGLIIQPIVGALSDRTVTRWGRRTPYFLIGAVLCSLALLFMPFSSTLLMAASLLWVLDAGNNVTMEPYRAYVSDRLDEDQHRTGFLTQSAFTGLAQTLAYAAPWAFVQFGMDPNAVSTSGIPDTTKLAFMVGAILSLSTIVWSVMTVRELPLSDAEIAAMRKRPMGVVTTFRDIGDAIRDMPQTMRQLAWVKLFQWYAMFCFWQFVALSFSKSAFGTTDASTDAFRQAGLEYSLAGAFYNFVAFASALLMMPLVRQFGAKYVHAGCLVAAAVAMMAIPGATSQSALWLPMIGIGLGWGSIMGNPYIMLAGSIPPERTGVYMGIFNMFIVIPMLLQISTFWAFDLYDGLLAGDPRNVLYLAGILMVFAAVATLRISSTAGRSVQRVAVLL
jgi:maltose/moltooligosaccharide transporter